MKEFMLGAMYWLNPNYGAKEIEEDMRRIHDNRFNIIRSFIWWEKVEPRRGMREYRQHDILFEAADKYGLKVMETFGLYLPLWLQKDLLAKGIDDRSRRYPCFDRPEVARPMEEFLRDTVERYKNAPALAIWNLWNEPNNRACKCPATLNRFTAWLKQKYPSIDTLRKAWLSEGQVFTTLCPDTLEELTPEWLADAFEFGSRGRISPMEYDWYSFTLDNTAAQMKWLGDLVKSIDPVHETHANPDKVFLNSLHAGLDEWKTARVLDSISVSVHPSHHFFDWKQPPENATQEDFNQKYLFCIDQVRGWAQGKDAWIGELQAGTTYFHRHHYTPSPEELLHTLYHSLGRGLRGVLFWEWQAWRSSLMEVGEFSLRRAQDGAPTERSEAARQFALDVAAHAGELAQASLPAAEVAIFCSKDTCKYKIMEQLAKPYIADSMENENLDAVYGCYKALNHANIAVDFLSELELEEGIPARYRILYLPHAELVSARTATELRKFVERGGRVWADGRFGWLDEHLYLRSEIPGYGLAEVFGCHEADFVGMALRQPDFRVGAMLGFRHLQYLEPTTGTALAGTSPRATIVHNRFGKGETLLIGSQVTLGIQRRNEIDPATVAEVASFALKSGIQPMLQATPAGAVECSRLTGPEADIFILGNRRPKPVSVEIEFTETYRQFETQGDLYSGGTKLQLSLKGRETRMVIGRKYRR